MKQHPEKLPKQDQVVELKFMGQKMVLKSHGDLDSIKEVVDLVSLRLSDVERRSKGAAAHQVALLALLELAEEYVKAKKRTHDHKKRIAKKAVDLKNVLGHSQK